MACRESNTSFNRTSSSVFKYKISLKTSSDTNSNSIIIPNLPFWKLSMKIHLNGQFLSSNSEAMETLMNKVDVSKYWESLNFKCEAIYSNESSLECLIKDKILNESIITKFNTNLIEGYDNFVKFQELGIEVWLYSQTDKLSILDDELTRVLNYVMISIHLGTLELNYPLVFNHKCRFSLLNNLDSIGNVSLNLVNSSNLMIKILRIIMNQNDNVVRDLVIGSVDPKYLKRLKKESINVTLKFI